jgi:hypothetical protein
MLWVGHGLDVSWLAQPSTDKINCYRRSDGDCDDDSADYRRDSDFLPGQPKIIMGDVSEHRSGDGGCKARDHDHES